MIESEKEAVVNLSEIGLILTCLSAFFTHIIHCLISSQYLLLLVGVIFPPVGIVHGIGLWFGVNW